MNNNTDTCLRELYIELLKNSLTFRLYPEQLGILNFLRIPPWIGWALRFFVKQLDKRDLVLARRKTERDVEEGNFWPLYAQTMVGLKRLRNVQECIEDVLENGIEGDFLEAGVWRGGCAIFMKGMLVAWGDTKRKVFVADSFSGFPSHKPSIFSSESGFDKSSYIAVSEEEVRDNFRRYGLLDDRVIFIKGYFEETLIHAPVEKLDILRIDADLYSAYKAALNALYDKLSIGGYCIIDDYVMEGCRAAVDEYRKEKGILAPLRQIDWTGVYWKKE
ncbi:TylF/MycF/NovP-related O-methyltransferase [Candidatus Methylacidiphilum infernorum]|uniref:Macrocin-O-methyltransferase n=1 Tax=Methylacidiphilum infernorum (isolate V4) TaxID=481448 RepID=B3DZH9_METI4|nr:TylF/MycF/NovP-related O-methyltransferase [Candidatus Methylacidiphilum infernorum]ACD82596.1 Macrocin-O-methyltransferase [Methylacidiphilum infernorum V4]